MKFAVLLLMSAVALALTVGMAAYANGGGHGEDAVVHMFAAADLNEDGVLTAGEYEEAGLAEMGIAFDDCDLDSDGLLTAAEYLVLFRMHHPPGDDTEV